MPARKVGSSCGGISTEVFGMPRCQGFGLGFSYFEDCALSCKLEHTGVSNVTIAITVKCCSYGFIVTGICYA